MSIAILPFTAFDAFIRVVACDVIRLVALVQLDGNSGDFTWNQVPVSIWTCIEPAVAITTACLVHLRPIALWMQHYWQLQPEPTSGPLNSNASEESCVAVQKSTAALIGMRSTSRKIVPPTKTRSPSNISWTDRRFAMWKAPSFGSMEFMTHITSNGADLRTMSIELRPTTCLVCPRTSHLTGYPSRRDDPSKHRPSRFPDVLDLLEVHDTNDTRTATSPSTPSTASGDGIDGSDSALAEIFGKMDESS